MSRFGAKRGKRLPGAEFSWDTEGGGEPDTAPTPLFPKYSVPIAKPLSEEERSQVDHYRRLREMIHDGPYYTVLSAPIPSSAQSRRREDAAKAAEAARKAQFDPFQGMATYGQRYLKKARTEPKLSGRSYDLRFFPKQLWSMLDPNYKGMKTSGAGMLLRGGPKRGFEDEEDDELDEEGPARKKRAGDEDDEDEDEAGERRRKRAGDDDDLLEEEEDEDEEEIVDDDFEDDEDDMGGDYNAEQYFDGGDDDVDYDGGGGEGDNDTY
ncbi:hypothetical protein AJ79_06267 [Helicocarpus griseus UAMH5409]|uniref:DNA-directed RNA polymerase III subunit n=1 Tax=Helicocarpus griseus UAMH5409 TaxID=1447875 RepID=A0A2B7XFM3_9EURO|nr:hypothetical protein AJ79_06267 [Helicocarpus griseus UAMH5409]